MPSSQAAYAELVDTVLQRLSEGVMPWREPWTAASPANLYTRREYQGVNRLLLRTTAIQRGYGSPYWVTVRQAQLRGGHVIPGELSRPVMACSMRWRTYTFTDAKGRPVQRWGLSGRSFALYNFEQTRGLGRLVPDASNLDFWTPTEAERIVANWKDGPVRFVHPDRAFYRPLEDRIGMPDRANFDSSDAYHATLFHEMVHATGHPSRCARFPSDGRGLPFGSPEYAFEELVAELGAVFLCGEAGIANRGLQDNAAYLGSWLEVLSDDRRQLFVAASLAEKACDTILGRKPRAAGEDSAPGGDDGEGTAGDADGERVTGAPSPCTEGP